MLEVSLLTWYEKSGVNDLEFQFEWDEAKAASNMRKHKVAFELACTIFKDPLILSVADVEHSETDERWFAVGMASNGSVLSMVYFWESTPAITKIRIISARRATSREKRQYQENL